MQSDLDRIFIDAVVDGNTLLASTLLQHGANPNLIVPDVFDTPLLAHACIECVENKADIIDMLIRNGSDINATDKLGRSALIYAAAQNDQEVINLLVAATANRGIRDAQGITARGAAIYRGFRKTASTIGEPKLVIDSRHRLDSEMRRRPLFLTSK